jgi:hypothetical protein
MSTTENAIVVIETYTGVPFNLAEPDPEQVCLEDIAVALSRICRFTGHCRHFYSVAEHSVLASMLAERKGESVAVQQATLMHDATEAYIGDINSPLKRMLGTSITKIEGKIRAAINERFNLADLAVHDYDLIMLASEAAALMPSGGAWWGLPMEPDAWVQKHIVGCIPDTAKKFFLKQCERLGIE